MEEIIINDCNLKLEEIEEIKNKCRTIFVNENNELLVAKYGEIYLLPGGTIDDGETLYEAIKRELKEELGMQINEKDLELQFKLSCFQKNYRKRDNTIKNRLVNTYFFVANVPFEINKGQMRLTDKEKESSFEIKLINVHDLEKIIYMNNINPRNSYFAKELEIILNFINKSNKIKKYKSLI